MREKIIDFHVHPFLEEKENMCFYKQSLSFENNRFVTDLKNSGITSCCGSVICSTGTKVAEGFEAIQKLNRHALELREKWGLPVNYFQHSKIDVVAQNV